MPGQFKTVDERCRACEVYGGEIEKCVTELKSAESMAAYGRPCHRVDLSPSNTLPASILNWLVHPELAHLASTFTASRLAGYSDEERLLILGRLSYALTEPGVMAAMHPPLDHD